MSRSAKTRTSSVEPPPTSAGPRVVRTKRGLRLVEGRDVLSDVLARPGATGGFFDALAACVVAFVPRHALRPRVALLGFAAGGVVAPLRAMGFAEPLEAVDLSRAAEVLFRELSATWAGEVRLTEAEASGWLRRQRGRYDLILEDLTVPAPGGAIKPRVSIETLPELMRDRLTPEGAVVTNVLPVPGLGWGVLLERLAAPHPRALVVTFQDYENKILIAGTALPAARAASLRLRAVLRSIRSRQASRFAVRAFV